MQRLLVPNIPGGQRVGIPPVYQSVVAAAGYTSRDLEATPILDIKEKWQESLATDNQLAAKLYEAHYKTRTDPAVVFASLATELKLILLCLVWTNSILVGSRALNYFVPGMCTDTSDWNFYTLGHVGRYYDFIAFFMSYGATCERLSTYTTAHGLQCDVCELLLGGHRLTLSHIRSKPLTAIEVVNSLNPSILACYISGINAVCIDPDLVRRKLCVLRYPTPSYTNCGLSERETIFMYKKRGVSFITVDEFFDKQHEYAIAAGDKRKAGCHDKPGLPTDLNLDATRSSAVVLDVRFKIDLGVNHIEFPVYEFNHDPIRFVSWADKPLSASGRVYPADRYVGMLSYNAMAPVAEDSIYIPEPLRFVNRDMAVSKLSTIKDAFCHQTDFNAKWTEPLS